MPIENKQSSTRSTSVKVLVVSFVFVISSLTFSTKTFAATYYWVGESTTTTNTSGIYNWAASSGGVGGAGVPGAADSVIFDGVNDGVVVGSAAGPVGYWKLDETSGTSAADSTGYGNTGTYVGSPTLNVAPPSALTFPSRAVTFNGSSQYVNVADSPSLNMTAAISISAWIEQTNTATAVVGHIFAKSNSGAGDRQYTLEVGGSGNSNLISLNIRKNDDSTWYTARDTSTISNGTWYHFVGTFDGSNVRLYRNGVLVATTPYVGTINAGTGKSASINSNTGYYFNGSIDDVRIYNRALSQAEITALAFGMNLPTSSYTVHSKGNVTINSNWSVGTTTVTSGYTGTITQSSGVTLTVGAGGYTQSGGTFQGGNANTTINGPFTLNTGSIFNASSATTTVNGNFINNAGSTGFVAGVGAVSMYASTNASATYTTGGATFYNLIFNTTNYGTQNFTLTDSFTVANNLTIQTGAVLNSYLQTWSATTPITITVQGNFSLSVTGNSAVPVFGNTNITINMTGANTSFLIGSVCQNGCYFKANLNFNGTGITTVSSGGTWSTGTTTINQSSGSVILSGNSTFNNLVINSGQVLSATNGVSSFNLTVNGNFINNAGASGFVSGSGTLNLYSTNTSSTVTTGGATFYNLTLSQNNNGNVTTALKFTDSFLVTNNLYPNTTGGNYSSTISANSPITIFDSGNFSMLGILAGTMSFGSNITINMTGVSCGFIIMSGTFTANVNFNGTGITTVSSGGTWSTGTTTINQSSGSVILSGNSTFNNLVINSGSVFNTSYSNSGTVYGPSSGLVGYWNLNDTNGVSLDSSGLAVGNPGIWVGAPTATTSIPSALASYGNSHALTFNGSSQYVSVANGVSLVSNRITLSGWVYPTVYANYGNIVSKNSSFSLYTRQNGPLITFEYYVGGTDYYIITNGAAPINQWSFVVGTYDGTSLRVYINGVLQTNQSASQPPADSSIDSNANPIVLAKPGYYGGYLTGSLDDVRIYNRALSQTEITALATGSTASSSQVTTTYNSSLTVAGNLTNNGTFNGGSATTTTVSIAGALTNSGTFTASAGTTTIDGNITMNGGSVFNHNNGILNLSGGDQTITTSQDLTFYSLTKANTNSTLYFNSGFTYNVLGTANLSGTANTTRLKLTPTLNGYPWNFNPSGNRIFNYLSPWYSNNISSPIDLRAFASAVATGPAECAGNVLYCDRGYNSNWLFGSSTLMAYWVGWRPLCTGVVSNANCWASTSGGVGPLTPTASFTLFFDGGAATSSAIFDSSALSNYAGISMGSTYTGTITQSSGRPLTIGSQGFVQNGGTWNSSIAGFTTNSFTQGGGVFNAPSAMTVSGTMTVSSGIFNASSTINVAGSLNDNTTSASTTLTSGLVGYWKLDENIAGTCTGGKDACDSSGNGNHGTWVGTPSVMGSVPVPPIQFSDPESLTFNGSSQYVSLSTSAMGAGTTYSVCSWFKVAGASAGGTNTVYSERAGSGATTPITGQLYLPSNNIGFIVRDNAGNTALAQGSTALTVGQWYHSCGVRNGNNTYVYLNGSLVGSGSGTLGAITNINYIIGGERSNITQDLFNGSLDDVRVYNRALSATEVLALATGFNNGQFSGGAFRTASSTVNLTGGSQSLNSQGTTTFNNLVKTISSTASLTFAAGKVFQILGVTNFAGASGQFLNLRSSQGGTQWNILPNPASANIFNILNVQDSNNLAMVNSTSSPIIATGNSFDNGHNTNWLFSIPGVLVSATSTKLATTTVPASGVMLGGAYTATRSSSGADLHITGITFKQNGSLPNIYLSNVRLYYNQTTGNCNTGLVYNSGVMSGGFGPATYTTTGKYTFSTTTGQLLSTSIPVSYGSYTCLYLRYDTVGSSTISMVGQTIDLNINNPLTDVIMDIGNASPSSVVDISGTNTKIDGTAFGVTSFISIHSADPTTDPTTFYLKDGALWMHQGQSSTTPATRLTPTNVTVASFTSYISLIPSTKTQVVNMSFILNEVDPKNPQKPTYSKSFSFTATTKVGN